MNRGAGRPKFGSEPVVDLMGAQEIWYTVFSPRANFRGIHDSILLRWPKANNGGRFPNPVNVTWWAK